MSEPVIEITASPEEKLEALKQYIADLGSLAVAYSSGVDSTFLLKVAHDVLGDRAIAITAKSCSFPGRELKESEEFCRQEGIRQYIAETNELEMENFRKNPPDRCYICKKALFEKILRTAADQGINYVAEGSNMDDLGDYRPGLRAIAELQVKSPLRTCSLTKAEIRLLSRQLSLPTWEKPSFACLSSRFPYGEEITEEKLQMVDRAEILLMELGFRQFRVRIHGRIARIEILPEDFPRLLDEKTRTYIYTEYKKYGFQYTALDLLGYRTGSLNENLRNAKIPPQENLAK